MRVEWGRFLMVSPLRISDVDSRLLRGPISRPSGAGSFLPLSDPALKRRAIIGRPFGTSAFGTSDPTALEAGRQSGPAVGCEC